MKIKLLCVSGSLRENSHGLAALKVALAAGTEFGAETELLDLRDAALPMYNPDAENNDESIRRVVDRVRWADAFILASPDYHGTMSGAMKNFLDYHWSELSGKMFGYLCASHEQGVTVMEQMRVAVRQCYGWSLPYNVSVHGERDVNERGEIINPRLTKRLRMMAHDVVIYGGLVREQFLSDVAEKSAETFAAKYG
jgi:NAD(P)H-dependent FMN reductase